ncbi:MAG TPA: histone deacetylase [Myxococcota bacterium]|jgi:acetoin utilization deacetylase AcuC-like enzyme
MAVPRATGVVVDRRYRDHHGPDGHPECPERLAAVERAIDAQRSRLTPIEARPASDEEILRVHGAAHLAGIEAAARQAPGYLDPDTFISAGSLAAARLAAGGAIELARQVASGRLHTGLAAVRPPGHHAEAGRPMGFCLFNNVAIAARALQAEDGVGRILIFDWDVHHGNGTQHSFDEDPSVLYASTHQFPYYPGSGAAGEAGRGKGAGTTLNIPLPAGCGDETYLGVLQRLLVPVTEKFRPDLILVSCGFDAHVDDPLAAMQVSGAGFGAMTRVVRALAEACCGGRVVFVLEGGYAASGLFEGTQAVLEVLTAEAAPRLPAVAPIAPGSVLEAVVGRVVQVHGSRNPGLGAP